MPDQTLPSFALIRFNLKTYAAGGVMAIVEGHAAAEKLLRDFEWGQNEDDRRAGWRYFLEDSELEPGMDAQKATKLRQLQLDLREAKSFATTAFEGDNTPITKRKASKRGPSPHTVRTAPEMDFAIRVCQSTH